MKPQPTRKSKANALRRAGAAIDQVDSEFNAKYTAQTIDSSPRAGTRETRLIEYEIHCEMCKRDHQKAIRYPGQPPKICDDCMSNYKTPRAARAALYDQQNPEAARERKRRYEAKRKEQKAAAQQADAPLSRGQSELAQTPETTPTIRGISGEHLYCQTCGQGIMTLFERPRSCDYCKSKRPNWKPTPPENPKHTFVKVQRSRKKGK